MKATAVSTSEELDHWLRTAPAGEAAVYHVGLLMKDRLEDEELDVVALRVWWEGRRGGRVELVQRRTTDAGCVYLAIKRRVKDASL